MLAATAAKLLASLDLDTKPFEAGARRVGGSLGQMESRFSRIGGMAKQGLSNVATNLTRLGVVAAGAIAAAVTSGIQSLADLERANQQTAAVIESTGGKAGVSAEQVRRYAEELEKVTTADDKLIQSGENLLLTFTGISSEVFPQATKAMVDLSIAMAQGDVANADFKSSAIQIGKALNDPIRGVTALRRVGVALTTQQEKQIKKFVEAGDVMSAQKIILKELETEFGEAGRAAGEGFGGDLRRLDDAFEDSRMALATGFLPVIRKVADALTTKLADPAVQKQISDFGVTLAGAFDNLLEIGGKLPWEQIGASLKIAGAGAKTILDAFTSLPPWVQTAVITGWGLNKLSGGMLGGIVGELGKGLIKGVLGMTAGVVNAKAGVVNVIGGPGIPGAGVPGAVAPAAAASGGFSLSALAAGAVPLTIAAFAPLALVELTKAIAGGDEKIIERALAARRETAAARGLDPIKVSTNPIPPRVGVLISEPIVAAVKAQTAADKVAREDGIQTANKVSTKAEKKFDILRERTEANRIALKTLENTTSTKVEQVRQAEQLVRDRVESARIAVQTGTSVARSNTDRIVAAVQAVVNAVATNITVVVSDGGSRYQSNYLNSNKPKAPMI